jgi:hypothetical protein
MAGFLKYLDQFETEQVTEPKKSARPAAAVATPKRVAAPAVVVEQVISESDEDSYLTECGWKVRNQSWIDPVTRNLLIWEAASAVQQERDRVGTMPVVEQVTRAPVARATPSAAPARPQAVNAPAKRLSMIEMASSALEGNEWDYENGGGGQIMDTFQTQPIPGEPTESYSSVPVTEEDIMLAEAQGDYTMAQASGGADYVRSNKAGMDMIAASDALFDF